MSLINDALKQTKQIRRPEPSSGPPSLPPVESTSRKNFGWLVPGTIVLLLVVAGIFIGLSLFKPMPLTASAVPAHHQVPVAVSAEPTQRMKLAATTPTTTTNTASNINSVAAAPPKSPELKLQGILFSAIRPCAIVSGRTVFVGDQINEFRVAAISRDSILLHNATKTKVLSLNPQ